MYILLKFFLLSSVSFILIAPTTYGADPDRYSHGDGKMSPQQQQPQQTRKPSLEKLMKLSTISPVQFEQMITMAIEKSIEADQVGRKAPLEGLQDVFTAFDLEEKELKSDDHGPIQFTNEEVDALYRLTQGDPKLYTERLQEFSAMIEKMRDETLKNQQRQRSDAEKTAIGQILDNCIHDRDVSISDFTNLLRYWRQELGSGWNYFNIDTIAKDILNVLRHTKINPHDLPDSPKILKTWYQQLMDAYHKTLTPLGEDERRALSAINDLCLNVWEKRMTSNLGYFKQAEVPPLGFENYIYYILSKTAHERNDQVIRTFHAEIDEIFNRLMTDELTVNDDHFINAIYGFETPFVEKMYRIVTNPSKTPEQKMREIHQQMEEMRNYVYMMHSFL